MHGSVIKAMCLVACFLPAVSVASSTYCWKYESLEGGVIRIMGAEIEDKCRNDSGDLHNVRIPHEIDGKIVREIGEAAFSGNRHISTLVIGSGVIRVGERAFSCCSNLVSVVMEDTSVDDRISGVLFVENGAFEDCINLRHVQLPRNLARIGPRAFANSGITSIMIPTPICNFDDSSFLNCRSLKSANIGTAGESLSVLFPGCLSLSQITVGENNRFFSVKDGVLCLKNGMSIVRHPPGKAEYKVVVPEGTTGIFPFAFEGCQSNEIVLPKGLLAIGRGAFSSCKNIKVITIPEKTVFIDDCAFLECSSLVEIVFQGGKLPTLGENVFPPYVKFKGSHITNEQRRLLEYAKDRSHDK